MCVVIKISGIIITGVFVIIRFLTVAPSTSADEQLVLDIVKFLTVVVTRCAVCTTSDSNSSAVNDTLSWIGEMLLNSSGALYHLLNKADLSAESADGKANATRYKQFVMPLLILQIGLET